MNFFFKIWFVVYRLVVYKKDKKMNNKCLYTPRICRYALPALEEAARAAGLEDGALQMVELSCIWLASSTSSVLGAPTARNCIPPTPEPQGECYCCCTVVLPCVPLAGWGKRCRDLRER